MTKLNANSIQKSLHEDYHSSEIKIVRSYAMAIMYVLKEILQFKESIGECFKLINNVLLNRKYGGLYSEYTNTSYVFMCNLRNNYGNSVKELVGIHVLLHELRHHVQHTKYPRLLSVAEKDAELFAWRVGNRNFEIYYELLKEG